MGVHQRMSRTMSEKPRSNDVVRCQRTLAERIKYARLNRGWTRPVLAAHSGVNQYTLKRFELTGEISLCDFAALCEALGGLQPLMSVLKPRAAVDVDSWTVDIPQPRQRGQKKSKEVI